MEIQILHWFESLHNAVLNPIMFGITTLGDKGIFWILMSLLCLFLLPKKYRKVGFTMFIALVLSVLFCNVIMKNLWQRPRCFWIDGQPGTISGEFENLYNVFAGIDDYSFPSGHTSASFAAALAVFMWRKREGVYAIVLAALIAISRLYLTVHYPTDVLVSLVLGSLYGVVAYFIAKWIIKKFPKFGKVMEGEAPYRSLFSKNL
jgi:undecaprenyl-diphosphatase